VSLPDLRAPTPYANDFCGPDRTRKKQAKIRQNARFALVKDRWNLPYIFLMVLKDVPKDGVLWVDYGDPYWEAGRPNPEALAHASACAESPAGGASLDALAIKDEAVTSCVVDFEFLESDGYYGEVAGGAWIDHDCNQDESGEGADGGGDGWGAGEGLKGNPPRALEATQCLFLGRSPTAAAREGTEGEAGVISPRFEHDNPAAKSHPAVSYPPRSLSRDEEALVAAWRRCVATDASDDLSAGAPEALRHAGLLLDMPQAMVHAEAHTLERAVELFGVDGRGSQESSSSSRSSRSSSSSSSSNSGGGGGGGSGSSGSSGSIGRDKGIKDPPVSTGNEQDHGEVGRAKRARLSTADSLMPAPDAATPPRPTGRTIAAGPQSTSHFEHEVTEVLSDGEYEDDEDLVILKVKRTVFL